MQNLSLALALMIASLLTVACDSEPRLLGLDEPIVGSNSELKHGDLPDEDGKDGARVTSLQLNPGVIAPGAPHLSVSGRTSDDAYAVGIRILELGTGYWLRPVGAADPSLLDELTFEFVFQAATDLPPGQYTLAAVAFDEQGKAGAQYTTPVCIESDLPDNGNACDPAAEPPPAIVSLTWNSDSDLDLIVQAPDGTRYDRSNRSLLEDDVQVFGLEYDASTACFQDGRRRENFVWYEKPERGSTWLIYANMFDACGRPAASFELTVYRSKKNADGTYQLAADEPLRGEFLRAQQNGGVGTPLYLTAVQL